MDIIELNCKLNYELNTNNINFVEPNNFIKLIEFGNEERCTVWWLVNAWVSMFGCGLPTNREEFLEQLLNVLKNNKGLKKQLHKIDWNK